MLYKAFGLARTRTKSTTTYDGDGDGDEEDDEDKDGGDCDCDCSYWYIVIELMLVGLGFPGSQISAITYLVLHTAKEWYPAAIRYQNALVKVLLDTPESENWLPTHNSISYPEFPAPSTTNRR